MNGTQENQRSEFVPDAIVPGGISQREILLKEGISAIVDAQDYDRLSKYRWFMRQHGDRLYAYRIICANGKQREVKMHRQILGLLKGNRLECHHINGNGIDNRRANLRALTKSEHMFIHGYRKNNTSGYRGIGWDKIAKKWRARVQLNGTSYSLGHHNTKEEAHDRLVDWLKGEGKERI